MPAGDHEQKLAIIHQEPQVPKVGDSLFQKRVGNFKHWRHLSTLCASFAKISKNSKRKTTESIIKGNQLKQPCSEDGSKNFSKRNHLYIYNYIYFL